MYIARSYEYNYVTLACLRKVWNMGRVWYKNSILPLGLQGVYNIAPATSAACRKRRLMPTPGRGSRFFAVGFLLGQPYFLPLSFTGCPSSPYLFSGPVPCGRGQWIPSPCSPACREKRLNGAERGDWESPSLYLLPATSQSMQMFALAWSPPLQGGNGLGI